MAHKIYWQKDIDVFIEEFYNPNENFVEFWAYSLGHNNPTRKVLRNLPPQKVYVGFTPCLSRGEVIPGKFDITVYSKPDTSWNNKIPKIGGNGYGELILCETYQECATLYNQELQNIINLTTAAKEKFNKTIDSKLKKLESCKLKGYIVE